MSAAAVDVQTHDDAFAPTTPALVRQQAAEVLAAHRSRRQRLAGDQSHDLLTHPSHDEAALSRSQRIASLVTERYAQSQSYRAFLAAEAEEATRKSSAAAEIAMRTAKAVAEAQQQLLRELAAAEKSQSDSSIVQSLTDEPIELAEVPSPEIVHLPEIPVQETPKPSTQISRAGLTVKLFEDAGSTRSIAPMRNPGHLSHSDGFHTADAEETHALDDEISFRQSPSFDLERASVPIPGNLLEFPRQLVAARKARPRYAEGPLCEEAEQAHSQAQLRIFEVEPSQITSQPPVESSTPEWSSIWLDALAHDAPEEAAEIAPQPAMPTPQTASLERRIMAATVDTCLAGMGFILFATAFAYTAPALPSLAIALVASAGALAAIFLLYQVLFFALSESTPGMRYARIGLCTFAEENPTRTAMLKRIPATFLAASPLGLGLLWACLDSNRLGWHDRLSGMYQRSY